MNSWFNPTTTSQSNPHVSATFEAARHARKMLNSMLALYRLLAKEWHLTINRKAMYSAPADTYWRNVGIIRAVIIRVYRDCNSRKYINIVFLFLTWSEFARGKWYRGKFERPPLHGRLEIEADIICQYAFDWFLEWVGSRKAQKTYPTTSTVIRNRGRSDHVVAVAIVVVVDDCKAGKSTSC